MEHVRPLKKTKKELAQKWFDTIGRKAFEETQNMGKFKFAWIKEKTRVIIEVSAFVRLFHDIEKRTHVEVGDLDVMHPFYRETLQTIIPLEKIRQATSHVQTSGKVLERIKRETLERIRAVKGEEQQEKIGAYRKRFLGRAKSVIMGLESSLQLLDHARKVKKDLPGVSVDLPTFVLAGFPNAGKSTLLGRWSGSHVRIADYPFTTQSVQVGKIKHDFAELQLLDTPGLLDRPMEERNIVEQHAIRALRYLANVVIFVVDSTPVSQYSLDDQKALMNELQELLPKIPFVIVINKMDACPPEQFKKVKSVFGNDIVLEGKDLESGLPKVLAVWKADRKKNR